MRHRANRPGWQCRSARAGPFATNGGGERHQSQAEATVSGEGGIGVKLERARAKVGLTEGQTEPVGFNPARLSWPFWAKFPNNSWATCPHQRAKYFFL
jgi:hypothetical protein